MKRRLLLIAGLVVACVGALAIRVVVEGRAALRVGDEAAKSCLPSYDARPANAPSTNPPACLVAIDAYETAARWYLPLAPHVGAAYRGMRLIAARTDPATAEPKGAADPAVALAAWRGIRSAARATRSLWTPHADEVAAADAAIARLSARDPAAGTLGERDGSARDPAAGTLGEREGSARDPAAGILGEREGSARDPAAGTLGEREGSARDPAAGILGEGAGSDAASGSATPDDVAAREAWHKERLARDVRPSIGAAALAGIGVLLWLIGVVVLVRRGLDRAAGWARRPAIGAGGMIVLGLVLWFVGLANA